MASDAEPPGDETTGPVAGLLEDLEQQAAGMLLAERDAELADRARGEYATVTFESRLHASVGRRVRFALRGGAVLEGRVDAVGRGWSALGEPPGAAAGVGVWLVCTPALVSAEGLSARAVPDQARGVLARLGLGSALHRHADTARELVVQLATGARLSGRLDRVGADFVELRTGERASTVLVPFEGVAAIRT
jgi:hypothetical protein